MASRGVITRYSLCFIMVMFMKLWRSRSWRIKHAHAAIVGGLFVAFASYSSWAFASTHQALIIAAPSGEVPIKGPLQIEFNQEINSRFNYNLSPGVAGRWEKHRGSFGIRSLTFQPRSQFDPGRIYQVKLGGMERALSFQALPERTVYFKVQAPAALASFSPADQAKDIATEPVFELKLKTPNNSLRKLTLKTEPATPIISLPPDQSDQAFRWKVKTPLGQGKTFRVIIEDLKQTDPGKRRFYTSTFTTVAEPGIASATTKDHFYPTDQITVKFAQAMQQSSTALKFDFGGQGKWLDGSTYQFSPTGLAPGKTYGYRVLKGAKSVAGGVLESDRNFQISTPGAIYLAAGSPGGSNVALNTPIKLTFDQPVNHASAEQRFSISPQTPGSFRWEGNTLVFVPSGWSYQTGYTASLAPGIEPVFGLPSNRVLAISFTTVVQTIKLNVPAYRQAYPLSCEAAALRMALAFRGIGTSDSTILGRLNYAPRPRDTASNSWDNPNSMFVGDVNGTQNTTGYGVHAGPLAAAAQSFGRGASAYFGISANFIASQIHGGNPVIIWGYSSKAILDSWNVPGGSIQAWKGEHTRTVYGVAGRPDAPVGFYINDPASGGQVYWTTSQLLGNLNVLGGVSNQAVVVN